MFYKKKKHVGHPLKHLKILLICAILNIKIILYKNRLPISFLIESDLLNVYAHTYHLHITSLNNLLFNSKVHCKHF